MELQRQFAIARRRLPLLAVSVVVAGVIAFAVTSVQPKVFEAEANLIVGQSLSGANPDYNELLVSQRLASTYAFVATTRPVLTRVIQDLGLDVSPEGLADDIDVSSSLDSALLTITARSSDPQEAADIANAVSAELVDIAPAVDGQGDPLLGSLEQDLAATRAAIDAAQAEVDDLLAIDETDPTDQARIDLLQSRLVTLRSAYASLLTLSANDASNVLAPVQDAVPPRTPEAPRPLLTALLAALAALIIASIAIFIAEYLDDSVRTPDDVEELTGLPTLGAIARMEGEDRGQMYQLAALLYPRSPTAEAYRSLRSNIEFASVDRPIHSLLVTSSVPGEGKTVTAANLALVFAQAGRSVLLVDADLRRPGLHTLFRLGNEVGLSTLLRGDEATVAAVAQATEQPNLRVVTSGPLPPNPAEVLGSKRMRGVTAALAKGADLVIFDSPPLRIVTDAAVLGSFLDGALFVIDASRSHRGAVRHGREASGHGRGQGARCRPQPDAPRGPVGVPLLLGGNVRDRTRRRSGPGRGGHQELTTGTFGSTQRFGTVPSRVERLGLGSDVIWVAAVAALVGTILVAMAIDLPIVATLAGAATIVIAVVSPPAGLLAIAITSPLKSTARDPCAGVRGARGRGDPARMHLPPADRAAAPRP